MSKTESKSNEFMNLLARSQNTNCDLLHKMISLYRVKDYVDLVRAGNLKLVVGINGAALLISDALGNSLGSRALGRYALGNEGNAAALDENIFSVLLY